MNNFGFSIRSLNRLPRYSSSTLALRLGYIPGLPGVLEKIKSEAELYLFRSTHWLICFKGYAQRCQYGLKLGFWQDYTLSWRTSVAASLLRFLTMIPRMSSRLMAKPHGTVYTNTFLIEIWPRKWWYNALIYRTHTTSVGISFLLSTLITCT